MWRIASLGILALLITFSTSLAQKPDTSRVKDGGNPVHEPDPTLWTTNLTVSATPAPKPALRYELLPPRRELAPGNAAVGYLRASIIRPEWPRDAKESQEQSDELERWSSLPIDQLPVAKMEAFLRKFHSMFVEVDDAARRTECNWQTDRLRIEDLGIPLAPIQGQREMIRFIRLRTRLLLAQKKTDEAFHSIQTSYQLGKHLGEGSTIIEFLVGLAITQVALSQLDDWVTVPEGANLYWAMTAMPRPLANPRQAIDSEARFQAGLLPLLKEIEAPMTEEAATKLLRKMYLAAAKSGKEEDPRLEASVKHLVEGDGLKAELLLQGPIAKKQLLARGESNEKVEKMPNAQAMLLRSVYRHRDTWDDAVKLFHLPTHRAIPEMDLLAERVKTARQQAIDDPLFTMFTLIYPAVWKVHHASARTERRFELLRAVEAVRLQVATNGGKLPASLAEVTVVPVPLDPFTGKAFEYTVKDRTFTLTAPRTKPDQPNMGEHIYIVTVRP